MEGILGYCEHHKRKYSRYMRETQTCKRNEKSSSHIKVMPSNHILNSVTFLKLVYIFMRKLLYD